MEKLLYFIVLVCAVSLQTASADKIKYKECGSNKIGKVIQVSVSGCDESMARCSLKRNTNATVEIQFEADKPSETLTAVVHGIILDVPWSFDLPNPDGCKDSGIDCPMNSASTYTYHATLPVLKKYPRVTVDVKWELKGGDEEYVCILIPSKLT